MNKQIEARLERSLANQVRVPRLDGRFDAAVWARIEASAAPAPRDQDSAATRWLRASNVIGAVISVALILYFVGRAFSGVEVRVPVSTAISLPEISAHTEAAIMQGLVWATTALAVGFGIAFTPIGRRIVASMR